MIRANEIVSRRNEKKTSEGRKVMLVPLKSENAPKVNPCIVTRITLLIRGLV
jgi:hypothetical protein